MKFIFFRLPKMRISWASLALGAVIGLAAAFVLSGRRVERTEADNMRLSSELSQARNDLERLGASLAKQRSPVVEEIELTVEGAPREETGEIRDGVREKLQILIGKELDSLDPEIVLELLRNARFQAGKTLYRVEPAQIVLARKSLFRLNASKEETPPVRER